MSMIVNRTYYAGGAKPGKGSGGGSGGASVAGDVSVSSAGFQILTGANVQAVLNNVDKKLASNEDFDSLLISLDVLSKDIGGITTVPFSALQADLHDGRPSHKAPGALVYDEFNTLGVIDEVNGETANIATLVSGGGSVRLVETLPILKNGLDQFYVELTANQIRDEINKGKIVQLSFDDVIENTGEQIYVFETFTKDNYAVFRRNVITVDKAERINIKVDYQGIVTFEKAVYNGATKTYVDSLIGNINTALDEINGENI